MKTNIRVGIATAGILCLWLFGGFYLAGSLQLGRLSNVRAITGLLGLVILFSGVLLGIKKAKKENPQLTYWQGLTTGITISLTVALVISIAGGIHFLLQPQYADDMIREAEASLRQSDLSPEEINRRLESVRAEYSFGMQLIQPLAAQSIVGTLFSAIISFFFRSKK